MSILSTYKPLSEDDEGLTPRQIEERREATRAASHLRYEAEMNEGNARRIVDLPLDKIMWRLELDSVQAVDLKEIAKNFLKRMEQVGNQNG